jgi:serine/threonine-protein kinase RsbW
VKSAIRHSITIPASTEHLGFIRGEVGRYARDFGFTDLEIQDIQLAVDEAVTNVIKHAYKFDASRTFDIRMEEDGPEFQIEIIDSGASFDQDHYREPDVQQRIRERKKGGVGVYLMRKLMDRVDYQSGNGRNHMLLVKRK